jgi:hypothetical protein
LRLKKEGWIIKNDAMSSEASTIHSVSSLFNYNLSKSNDFSKLSLFQIGPNYLMKSLVIDSLSKKNISIVNFGIFDLGNTKPFSTFYFYPKNFFQHFIYFTTYRKIIDNTTNFKADGLRYSYYPTEVHNKYILENFSDSISHIKNDNIFIYAHLLMPHSPFRFNSEFQSNQTNSLPNYKNYWEFTNLKIFKLLLNLTKENKYRIILVGDHGFRGDKRINPHETSMAFYGFEDEDLYQIQSIQDLGSLINGSYKCLLGQ